MVEPDTKKSLNNGAFGSWHLFCGPCLGVMAAVIVACGSSSIGGSSLGGAGSDAASPTLDASTPPEGGGSEINGDASPGSMTDGSISATLDASGTFTDASETPDDANGTPANDSAMANPEGSSRDAGGCALETVSVSAAGSPASFATSLSKDATYLLKAVGSVNAGAQQVDAEFAFSAGGTSTDIVGAVDVGIDVGLLWPNRPMRFTQTPPGPSRMKWNPLPQIDVMNNVTPGSLFRADSTYYMIVIGNGQPLSLKLALPPTAPGTGSISVSLYALSPSPPPMYQVAHSMTPSPPAPPKTCAGDALDTIDISVAMPAVVAGKYTTDATKLYLLQASGTGPTGAAGLGDGDAEYMDFGSSISVSDPYPLFNGYNDGEACADFGLGVDELTVSHCKVNATCTHRKNWWGTVGIDANTTTMFTSPTYRNDHVYYMIYAGTGKPISLAYFDSGYGDNQPFDVMARIFAVP